MRSLLLAPALLAAVLGLAGCLQEAPPSRGVYLLLNASAPYARGPDMARRVAGVTLARLGPGDAFALARVDAAPGEGRLLAETTLDDRPSLANGQKRALHGKIRDALRRTGPAQSQDLATGVRRGVRWLEGRRAEQKVLLILSDLKGEPPRDGEPVSGSLPLTGLEVVAVNVTKLHRDSVDPQRYLGRLGDWQQWAEEAGGDWRVVNEPARMTGLFSEPARMGP